MPAQQGQARLTGEQELQITAPKEDLGNATQVLDQLAVKLHGRYPQKYCSKCTVTTKKKELMFFMTVFCKWPFLQRELQPMITKAPMAFGQSCPLPWP